MKLFISTFLLLTSLSSFAQSKFAVNEAQEIITVLDGVKISAYLKLNSDQVVLDVTMIPRHWKQQPNTVDVTLKNIVVEPSTGNLLYIGSNGKAWPCAKREIVDGISKYELNKAYCYIGVNKNGNGTTTYSFEFVP